MQGRNQQWLGHASILTQSQPSNPSISPLLQQINEKTKSTPVYAPRREWKVLKAIFWLAWMVRASHLQVAHVNDMKISWWSFGLLPSARWNKYCMNIHRHTHTISLLCTSMSGRALRALKRVMVFPEPGGPHSTRGLCSASQVYSNASWRTVSRVGTTTSGAATLCVSTSIWGTLDCHGTHSPVMDT